MLENGYMDVPAGKVAFVVTSLEMRAPPAVQAASSPRLDQAIRLVRQPDADWYRELFGRIGTDWLWFARLKLSTTALEAIIHDRQVEVYALSQAGRDEGLLELDFREPRQCELTYFGLAPGLIGQGAGRVLMRRAVAEAWRQPIERFWVHTCTGDHPSAVGFYMRSGFVPYRRQIEIADDPRLAGLMPKSSAPHVPVIGS